MFRASNIETIKINDKEASQNKGPIAEDIINLSNSQGSIVADLSVNSSGGANYSIPIVVPPGLNGVNPEISLDFNSQSGNGMAGWGWNISGVSTISRIPSTLFHDNQINPVKFDLDDRFALDGQRLILKSGSYGVSGSVYQTEQYSNLKIVAHGSNPDTYGQSGPISTKAMQGPEYFKVFYPDGSIAYYGSTQNSRGAMDYAITHWENPQGVRISYKYNRSNKLSIDEITYGSIGEANPINKIHFGYENRDRDEEAYIGGLKFTRSSRLNDIWVTGNNGSIYRRYTLNYGKTSLEYDRLISVEERYGNVSFPKREVTFNYGNTNFEATITREEASQLSLGNIEQRNAEVIPLDFTGNGKTDLIVYPKTGVDEKKKFWFFKDIHNPGGFNYRDTPVNTGEFEAILPVNWLSTQNKLMTSKALAVVQNSSGDKIDFNVMVEGPAIANGVPVTSYTKTWNAPLTNNPVNNSNVRIPQQYVSGDFDGDGLSDVLAIAKPLIILHHFGGAVTPQPIVLYDTPSVHSIKLDRRIGSGFTINLGNLTGNSAASDRFFALEMNGDGKTDLVRFIEGGNVQVYSINATNDGLDLLWEKADSRIKSYFQVYPGDYNGDGLGDFLIPLGDDNNQFLTFQSKGNGFLAPVTTQPFMYKNNDFDGQDGQGTLYGYNLIPVDINGDAKTDIISYNTITYNNSNVGSQSIKVYKNTGQVTQIALTPKLEEVVTPNMTYSGYLKHFPIPIFSTTDKPNNALAFASISDKWVSSFTFSTDHKEDVTLKEVVNNGITTTIKYDKVDTSYIDNDDPDFFKAYKSPVSGLTQVYPFVSINVAPSFRVVRELEQTGSGLTRKRRFRYKGAVSHATGLGFRGFEIVKSSNWYGNNAPAIWTINKHDPMLRGAVTEQTTTANSYADDPSSYMSKVNYFYDYKLIANPGSPIAPEYDSFYNRNTSIVGPQLDEVEQYIKLLPGFYANGSNGTYTGKIVPPEQQPGAAGYAGAVDIRLNRKEIDNGLTGVMTTDTYTYDPYNNPLTTTTSYPGGSRVLTYQYSNNASATNSTYHIGKPLKMIETLSLNGSSFSTEEQYVYNNNQVETIRRKGKGTGWIIQNIEYDGYGNIDKKTLVVDGEAPRIETFEYSSTYGHRFLTKSVGIDGLETTFDYDSVTGSLLTSTDVYGLTTSYGHDNWDRVITETDYLGNTTNYTTEYQQDGGTKTTVDYPQGSKTENWYNAFGWEIRSGVLTLNNQWSYTSYEHDASGKLIRQSEPHNGSPGQWTVTNFDGYNRVVSQQLYTGRNITSTYSGLSNTVNDGVKTVTTTLDALGNTIKVQDTPGGAIDYTYHASGQLKSANYDGNIVTIGVDGWGRKTSLNDPSAGTYTYEYNNYGELKKQTSPKGTTSYKYDPDGKVTEKKIVGELTDLLLTYQYHENTTKQLKKIIGTDKTNSNRVYTYDYEYGAYERPDKIIENTGLANFTYEMGYDTYGRIEKETQTTVFGGITKSIVTQNVYDTSGLLKEILNFGTPDKLWELNQINARGQALTVTLGNGMTQTKMYDAYGYLEKIEDKESGTNPTVALHTEYDFNTQRGTLNNRENFGFDWQETFDYDTLDRLTAITGDVTHAMGYNPNGTIDTNTALGDYAYGDTGKKYRLTEIDPNTAGETYFQQHPTQKITYNAYKKPITVHQEGHGWVNFEYGPMMNRSTAYYGGEDEDKTLRKYKKHYSAIMPVEIVEDTQTNTTKIITYVGGDAYSAPIAHIKTTGAGAVDEYHYLHRDYLGSIMAITDADGDVKEERQFGAWGVVDQFLDSNGNTTFDHNSLLGRGYTGHEHFFEVGLIHMNGRMYDANLGRFLSPDNYIQDPFNTQNYNRYAYVLNNPLMYNDPSGEEGIIAALIIAAKIIVGLFAVTGIYGLIHNYAGKGSPSDIGSEPPSPSNNQNNSQISSSIAGSERRSAFNDGGRIALNIPAVDTSGNAINYTLGNNFSFQDVSPTGISLTGRADPLQGMARPEGWEYDPAADAQQFNEPEGFNITTEDVVDMALDFVPVVGGLKDIYNGIQEGNGWMVALGAGSIVLDVFTLGGSSIVKGAIKTGIKAGGRSLAKRTLKKGAKYRRAAKRRAVKEAISRFDSVDDLIVAAGDLSEVKGGLQGFVKGNGNAIFDALTKGAKSLPGGRFLLNDGTNIGRHISSWSGDFTINFNRAGEVFKIRIIQ
ncbi:RHS repeat-associated core domain-containing protein [Maribacter sp. 2304DJ31-5]|uniref:RHS repeat-associated core domain-containing protein n=1 Tax=Maribacter sp. 2304DJ31-5 TaxID=3386273 RepID=UPI0039BCADBC